jgi:hypothetical protein
MLGGTDSAIAADAPGSRPALGLVAVLGELAVHRQAHHRHVRRLRSRDARRDVDADDHHLQQAAAHVANQRCDEFDDARADFGAVHDEPGQDEEWQGEKNEAPGAALRVHHHADQVTRADGLDAHDADGGKHEADRHAHRDQH